MSISHHTSVSLLIGLCVAGCAAKPGVDAPVADNTTTTPRGPTSPSLSPDEEAQRQSVVVDTVGDTVDRFDRIIRQREQAKQSAADVREARGGPLPPVVSSSEATEAAVSNEASKLEKLAAQLRTGKMIDETPAPQAKPEPAPGATSNGAVAASGDVAGAAPLTSPGAPIAKPSESDPLASGSLNSGTGVQIARGNEAAELSPNIARNGDPLEAVRQKFSSRVAEDPRDLAAQLELQVLRWLKDEPVPAMNDLAALPSEDRELVAAVCDALSNFRSLVRAEPNPLNSEKARPFIEMAERIRTRADLTLSGLTLCTQVSAFGVYNKIEPLVFNAGEPTRAVVYCEVDGFLSQLNGNQAWDTKLSLELRLYDSHGLPVWHVPADETVDSSNRRRRDFFLAKRLQLPPNLAGGNYMLKATVRDLQANRVAEQTIQFTVNPKV